MSILAGLRQPGVQERRLKLQNISLPQSAGAKRKISREWILAVGLNKARPRKRAGGGRDCLESGLDSEPGMSLNDGIWAMVSFVIS